MSAWKQLGGIDRMVHEPSRLMILAVLSGVEESDFLFLLEQTELTKGNLSSHVGRLEDAGYVEVEKAFVNKVPRTVYRLTKTGAAALRSYRAQMAGVLTNLQ